MIKLNAEQIADLSIRCGGLTERQVLIGWEIIQDKFKGVNQFSDAVGTASRGTYIRDIFVAFYKEQLRQPRLPLRTEEKKPKQRLSRY